MKVGIESLNGKPEYKIKIQSWNPKFELKVGIELGIEVGIKLGIKVGIVFGIKCRIEVEI